MGTIIEFDSVKKHAPHRGRSADARLYGGQHISPDGGKHYHPRDGVEAVASPSYFRTVDQLQGYALAAFREALAQPRRLERVQLPRNLERIMQDPKGKLPTKVATRLASLPVKRKQQLIYAMVSAAHDGWARDNPGFFYAYDYVTSRHYYLEVELGGLGVYRRFLDLLQPTIERLGLSTDLFQWDSEKMYECKQHKFFCEHGLTAENLRDYITTDGAEYTSLDPGITDALRHDLVVIESVAAQVMTHTPLGNRTH